MPFLWTAGLPTGLPCCLIAFFAFSLPDSRPPPTQRLPSLSRLAPWSCLPLLALIAFLLVALNNAHKEASRLRQAAEELAVKSATLKKRIDEATTQDAKANSAASGQKKAETKKKPAIASGFSDSNAIADPEFGAPILRRERRYAMANHRKAIDALGLPPAETARLKDLEVQKWNAIADVKDLRDRSSDTGSAEKTIKLVEAEMNQEIVALLGEETFASYEKLKSDRTEQSIHWGLDTAFWDAGLALSPTQRQALARARTDADTLTKLPNYNKERDPLTGFTAEHLAMLNSAATFLSPDQLALLRTEEQNHARYDMLGEMISARKTREAAQP